MEDSKVMKIDEKDAKYVGKLTVPFILAIFLALLLEDVWESMTLEQQLGLLVGLVMILLLIYRKKVKELLR
jgi:hypothetical protein